MRIDRVPLIGLHTSLKQDMNLAAKLAERDRLDHHPRRAGLFELFAKRRLPFGEDGDVHEAFAVELAHLVIALTISSPIESPINTTQSGGFVCRRESARRTSLNSNTRNPRFRQIVANDVLLLQAVLDAKHGGRQALAVRVFCRRSRGDRRFPDPFQLGQTAPVASARTAEADW